MCEVSERIFAQGIEDGRKLWIALVRKNIARKLYQKGSQIADIADILEVSEKQVEEWLSLQMA